MLNNVMLNTIAPMVFTGGNEVHNNIIVHDYLCNIQLETTGLRVSKYLHFNNSQVKTSFV